MAGDNIKMTVSSATGTPTTSFTLGSAPTGYNTIGSQYSDGDVLTYFAWEGDDFQICTGTYTASGTTLSVDKIWKKSVSGTVTYNPTGITFTSSAEIIVTDAGMTDISRDLGRANNGTSQKYIVPVGAEAGGEANSETMTPTRILFTKTYIPANLEIDAVVLSLTTGVASSTTKVGIAEINPDGTIGGSLAETAAFNTQAADQGDIVTSLSSSFTTYDGGKWVYLWVSSDSAIAIGTYSRAELNGALGMVDTCDVRGFGYRILGATTSTQPNYPASDPTINYSKAEALAIHLRWV